MSHFLPLGHGRLFPTLSIYLFIFCMASCGSMNLSQLSADLVESVGGEGVGGVGAPRQLQVAVGTWTLVAGPSILTLGGGGCGVTNDGHLCMPGSTRVPGSPQNGYLNDWASDTGTGNLAYYHSYTWPGTREPFSSTSGTDPVLVVIKASLTVCNGLSTPLTFSGATATLTGEEASLCPPPCQPALPPTRASPQTWGLFLMPRQGTWRGLLPLLP